MIKSKFDLKKILEDERKLYISSDFKKNLIKSFTQETSYSVWKFVKNLRKAEYYSNKKGKLNTILYYYYRRRYNTLGKKLSIEIYDNCFQSGLKIYHPSSIVVHNHAKIGKNCKLHGNNCIGNNGYDDDVPYIGDNVDIGVGAKIIGGVTIANNIVIGANSVVTRSFLEEGVVLIGTPAKKLVK